MTDLPQWNSGRGQGARRRSLALLLAVLAAAAPVRAQDTTVRTTVEPRPPAADVEVRDGAIHLSREEAAEIALRQNLGLVIERYNRTQSAMSVYQQLGIYDLLTRASASAQDVENEPINQTQPNRLKQFRLDLGLTQVLPTGGDISFDINGVRSESVGGLAIGDINYSNNGSFTFNQPLLRDFGRLATERNLLLARTNSQISRQEFERQTEDILRQVDDAYWNLVESREQVRVAEESLALARELHQRNEVQVEVGTLAPLELVQSEAQIATREEGLIGAQANVGDAADQLRRLLNFPPGQLWDLPIQATTDPQTEPLEVDLDQAIATAFAERPELRSQELAIENARLEQAFASNQARPQLDFSINYGAGASDELGFSDPLEELFALRFPGWAASLNFTYPLQNRAGRAAKVIANLDLERTGVELEQLQQVIRTEVRQAARGVDTAAKTIDAARASRVLQERNLDAERKRYENGMSTSFQITRIQDDLTQARSREVSAIVNYRRALTEFYRATGRLLDREGVQLLDEEPPIRRFDFTTGDLERYGSGNRPPGQPTGQ
jgi:outer membrane protein